MSEWRCNRCGSGALVVTICRNCDKPEPSYADALRDVAAFLHDRASSVLDAKGNPEAFRALVKAARAIEAGEVRHG